MFKLYNRDNYIYWVSIFQDIIIPRLTDFLESSLRVRPLPGPVLLDRYIIIQVFYLIVISLPLVYISSILNTSVVIMLQTAIYKCSYVV